MAFDAVILSGGRASRLGGTAKADIIVDGRSLLSRALDAAADARVRVVVGDAGSTPSAGVLVTRETPAFGGPAAAIGAGLRALDRATHGDVAERILVLACDMPGVGDSVQALLSAAESDPSADGALAVDPDGRRQYLAAVYQRDPLIGALRRDPLGGMSMRTLLEGLELTGVPLDAAATADIDTWEDARRWGVSVPVDPPGRDQENGNHDPRERLR